MRPLPPEPLREPGAEFRPAPEVEVWLRETFLSGGSLLFNPDHEHLEFARIGCLWTNVTSRRGGRYVVGTCERPHFDGAGYRRARQEQQFREWFGEELPDFVITLWAPFFVEQSDLVTCAIAEHELYHAGQARGEMGEPLYNRRTGRPKLALRGHDAEEFAGVVRRWGVGAASEGVADLVAAAGEPPEIRAVWAEVACGYGRRLAA